MVMEDIFVLLVDFGQNPLSALLLIIELKTLAPSWAISNTPTHLIFALAWEKLVVLDQI
jgi:hypothetical protein